MGKDKNILYLGNLRRDLPLIELKNNLLELFCNYIGVVVDWNDIDIKKGKQAWFAFVDLHDEGEASETLEELASWENRRNLRYNFTYIVQPYESLTVDYKKVKKPRKIKKKPKAEELIDDHSPSGSRNNNAVGKDDSKDAKAQSAVKKSDGPVSNNDKKGMAKQSDKDGEKTPSHSKPKTTTSKTEGLETARAGLANLSLSENHCSTSTSMTGCPAVKGSLAATSTTGLVQTFRRHYIIDQKMGPETRSREYKLGSGNYMKKQLNKDVGKYVCGFLNSREAGSLMIGVNDSGHVKGVECSQSQEDKVRLDIDMAIKTINPAIFPNMYTVEFVPVLINSLQSEPPLFVLEITVKSIDDTDVLYATCGDVYVRRDGSVQGPLKGAEIQEWTRQTLFVYVEETSEGDSTAS
ncbi:uncharacterized protein [Argopecten irradians]|uniref:uncharacterized protein isoform X2 n=1 Tax=Argopecten irradians TaxID=31199 RepID=UPI00370FC148